jgi:hypothetical protein
MSFFKKKEKEHFNKSFMNINYIKNLLETDKINNKIIKLQYIFLISNIILLCLIFYIFLI